MIKTSNGEYTLKYTYNAMAEYEERFHRDLMGDILNINFGRLRALMWAGLLHLNPNRPMNEAQVGDIIEDAICAGATQQELMEEVMNAMNNALFIKRLAENNSAKTKATSRKERAQGKPSEK